MKKNERNFSIVICGLLIVFGWILRLPLLTGSFWLDEAAQALESSRPLSQQLQIKDDFQPPLIHLIVFALLHLSKAEWILRTGAALIPGVLSIGIMYLIGHQFGGKKTGLLTAILLATSSFHIFYSQELRPYSLPTLFACLSWLAILSIGHLSHPKKTNQQICFWAIWSILGLYSSYLYFFVCVGQCFFLFLRYRKQKQLLINTSIAVAAIGFCFSLWLPSFFEQLHAGQQLRTQLPGWEQIVSFSQLKSLALVGGKFLFGVLDLSLHPLYVISGAAFGLLTLMLLWQIIIKKSIQTKQIFLLLFTWIIIPILLPWALSFWLPVLQPKRVLFALPGFYLGLSWLIISVYHQSKKMILRAPALVLSCGLLLLNLFSTVSYFSLPKYQREDWRGMHALITQKYPKERSIVVQAFPAPFASWEWYNRRDNYPTFSTGVFTLSENSESEDRLRLKTLADRDYILVFDYLRDLTDTKHLIDNDLERFGYTEVDQLTPVTPLGIVHVYARARQMLGYSQYSAP